MKRKFISSISRRDGTQPAAPLAFAWAAFFALLIGSSAVAAETLVFPDAHLEEATPESQDMDGKKLADAASLLARTVPYDDSDGHGVPDAWEMRHGFNPAEPADGRADADGDDYTNIEEFLNGTKPLSKETP